MNGVGLSTTIIYTWLGCWSRELERGTSQSAKNLFTQWETWTSIGTDILVFRIPTVEVKPCLTKLMGNTFRTTARPWKPPTIHCILVVSTCIFILQYLGVMVQVSCSIRISLESPTYTRFCLTRRFRMMCNLFLWVIKHETYMLYSFPVPGQQIQIYCRSTIWHMTIGTPKAASSGHGGAPRPGSNSWRPRFRSNALTTEPVNPTSSTLDPVVPPKRFGMGLDHGTPAPSPTKPKLLGALGPNMGHDSNPVIITTVSIFRVTNGRLYVARPPVHCHQNSVTTWVSASIKVPIPYKGSNPSF